MPSWKAILIVLSLALAAAYQFRDSDFVKITVKRVEDLASFSRTDGGSVAKPKTNGSATLVKDLHKCQTKTRTLYISEACPPGSLEIPIKADGVTVVPATLVPAPAKGDKMAGSTPNVRDLLLQGDDENLRAKHMDAVIGK